MQRRQGFRTRFLLRRMPRNRHPYLLGKWICLRIGLKFRSLSRCEITPNIFFLMKGLLHLKRGSRIGLRWKLRDWDGYDSQSRKQSEESDQNSLELQFRKWIEIETLPTCSALAVSYNGDRTKKNVFLRPHFAPLEPICFVYSGGRVRGSN